MKVVVVNESPKHIAARDIQRQARRICRYFANHRVRNRAWLATRRELTVVFLSAAEIKKINRQFRGKNKPTDILSFTSEDPASLGELLLCLPVLERQARENGHSLESEITYMLVHGILHLLGYDHEASASEERWMFRLQDRCFEVLT